MLQNCSYVSIVISSVYFLLVCYLLARFYALETFLSNVIEAVLTGGNDVNCRGTHIPSGWSPGRLLLFFFFFYVGARYCQNTYGSIFSYIQNLSFCMHRTKGFR